MSKVRNKRGYITTNLTKIKRFVRKYHKQFYANKLDNSDEMDKYQVNQITKTDSKIENPRPITSKEIELVIKNLDTYRTILFYSSVCIYVIHKRKPFLSGVHSDVFCSIF